MLKSVVLFMANSGGFWYSLSKYFLSAYSVPGSVYGMTKIDKVPTLIDHKF